MDLYSDTGSVNSVISFLLPLMASADCTIQVRYDAHQVFRVQWPRQQAPREGPVRAKITQRKDQLTRRRCKKCKGEKTVKEKTRQEIFIEKGMPDGHRIVLAGAGDQEVYSFEVAAPSETDNWVARYPPW